jgi:hypothetical protein
MSLRLLAADPSAPIPRKTILVMACDNDHGLFPPPPVKFDQDGFIAQYTAAMRAGWLDLQDCVLCPECSGKQGA